MSRRGPRRQRRWDVEPLLATVGADTIVEAAARLGTKPSVLHHYRRFGIPEASADLLAVRHGVHPCLIWPDWFDRALADEERAA